MKEDGNSKVPRFLVSMLVLAAIGVAFLHPMSIALSADKYPAKPVQIIVPFRAGGNTDINMRIWAQFLPKYLGQPVVVQNNPGPGAVAGTLEVGRAEPDGYTIGVLSDSLYTSRVMLSHGPDPNDFEPVAQLVANPYILVVSEKLGFKNVQDMVAYAKKNPKELLVAINPGTGSQIYTVILMKGLGIEPQYVPSKGGGERAIALAGGHQHATLDSFTSIQSLIDGKKVRALATTSAHRIDMYKEIPTLIEQGFNIDTDLNLWEGLLVRKGTPPEVTQTLLSAFEKVTKDKGAMDQFKKIYSNVAFVKSEELKKFLAKNEARLRKSIFELGLDYKK